MKLGPIAIAGPRGGATLSADFDLRKLVVETQARDHSSAAGSQVLVRTAADAPRSTFRTPSRRQNASSTSAPFPPDSPRRRSRAKPTASPRSRPTFASALSSTGASRASGSWIDGSRRSRTGAQSKRGSRGYRSACATRKRRRRRPNWRRRRREAAQAAADKADAEKAAAEPPEPRQGETRERAAAGRKAPIDSRFGCSKSDELGANAPFSAAPTPPVRPKARPSASRPDPRRALLIRANGAVGFRFPLETCGALRLEHKNPNGRGQIGVAARGVDHSRQRVEGQSAFGGDVAQPAPEGVLQGNAGAMTGDDERAFDDARVRGSVGIGAPRSGGPRGWPPRSRVRFGPDVSRPSTGQRRRGFDPRRLPHVGALFAFARGAD